MKTGVDGFIRIPRIISSTSQATLPRFERE
jgi:hypothetical protein